MWICVTEPVVLRVTLCVCDSQRLRGLVVINPEGPWFILGPVTGYRTH
jgi:hypothetical protein